MTIREILIALVTGALGSTLLIYIVENHQLTSQLEAINKAVQEEQINHAKQLSKASDSLVLASKEYDSVRAERASLVARLRKSASGGSAGDSLDTCRVRASRLEAMVADLHELVEACDRGWQGCASRKDALIDVVR